MHFALEIAFPLSSKASAPPPPRSAGLRSTGRALLRLAASLLALPYRRHGRRTPRTAAMPGRQRRRRQTRGGDGRPEEEEARRGRGQRRPSASPWTPRAVPSTARLPRPGPRAAESRAAPRRPSAYHAEPRGPLPPCPRPAAVHAVARSGRAGLLRRHRREGGGPRIRPPAPTERRRRRAARWGRKWRAGAGRGKGEEGGRDCAGGGYRRGKGHRRRQLDLHPLCWRRDFFIARYKHCRRGKTSIASPILRCVVEVTLRAAPMYGM